MKYCNNLSIPQKIVFATFFQIHRNYRTTLRNICSRNPLFHSKLKKMVTLNFPSFSFQNYNIVTPQLLKCGNLWWSPKSQALTLLKRRRNWNVDSKELYARFALKSDLKYCGAFKPRQLCGPCEGR